jgi:hypothetical protein
MPHDISAYRHFRAIGLGALEAWRKAWFSDSQKSASASVSISVKLASSLGAKKSRKYYSAHNHLKSRYKKRQGAHAKFGALKSSSGISDIHFTGAEAQVIVIVRPFKVPRPTDVWPGLNKNIRDSLENKGINFELVDETRNAYQMTGPSVAINWLCSPGYAVKSGWIVGIEFSMNYRRPLVHSGNKKMSADAQAKLGEATANGYRLTFVPERIPKITSTKQIKQSGIRQREKIRQFSQELLRRSDVSELISQYHSIFFVLDKIEDNIANNPDNADREKWELQYRELRRQLTKLESVIDGKL